MNYATLWNATIICTLIALFTLVISLGHPFSADITQQEDRIIAKRGPTGRIVVVHQHPHHVPR